MPLSSHVALELRLPENALLNLNKCDIKILQMKEVDYYNSKLLTKEGFLISSSMELLVRYANLMDENNKSPLNPYVVTNLERLDKINPKSFHIIMIKLVEEEIKLKNSFVCGKYKKLLKSGISIDEAKDKIAKAIANEVKASLLLGRKIDWSSILRDF